MGPYLCKVVTDHSAIRPLLKTINPTDRLARWIMQLAPYQFEVIYRSGKLNTLADGLSRFLIFKTEEPVPNINGVPLFFLPKIDIQQLQEVDGFCGPVIRILRDPTIPKFHTRSLFYVLKEQVLCRKVVRDGKPYLLLVLPKELWTTVPTEAYDSLVSGSLGVAWTYARIKDRYFFPGALEGDARYVATCETCQHRNTTGDKPGGFLQLLRVSGPFLRVHMDFCGPFTQSARRNKYILSAICSMTKYIVVQVLYSRICFRIVNPAS